jgi:VCBS repeat-containing protein
MSRVSGELPIWQGSWDASGRAGDYTIEVQAIGTTTVSDTVRVQVGGTANRPPVAANESYSADSGKTLAVGAPGVLDNDSDPNGDSITAVQASGPGHGTLTLNANGGFSYTPASGYSGPDSFTYRSYDGALYSASATASITVSAPPDRVAITAATWTKKTQTLSVTATSDAAPTAALTVNGTWKMTYKAKTRTYTLQVRGVPNPETVLVTSSFGGTATKTVTTK